MSLNLLLPAIGRVKECHRPLNELCPHNLDPRFDCTCRSELKRQRKPFRRVLVHDETVDRGYRPDIVIEVYPKGGTICLREKGRRRRYCASTGDILAWMVRRAALSAMASKRAKKKTRKRR